MISAIQEPNSPILAVWAGDGWEIHEANLLRVYETRDRKGGNHDSDDQHGERPEQDTWRPPAS